jgi:hypothetical protein
MKKTKALYNRSNSTFAKQDPMPLVISMPTGKIWENLVCDLKLNSSVSKQQQLKEFMGDIVADVLHAQKVIHSKIDREEGIRRIKNLELRIANLIDALKMEGKNLVEIVPHSALGALGELFTVGAATIVANKSRFPATALPAPIEAKQVQPLLTLQEVEQYYKGLRQDNGLLYGANLINLALDTIHTPLKEWLQQNSLNKGGRPKKTLRDFMVDRIIIGAEKILEVSPHTKRGGDFLTFCNLCLVNCGVPEDGLDKAIAAAINQRSKKQSSKSSKLTTTKIPKLA